jgi:CHASE3 domain sensor protein/GAF domain-containing protein
MKQKLQKEAIIYLLYASMIVTLLSGIFTVVNNQRVEANNKMITHTYEVLQSAEELLSLLKDAEVGQRGYLLTQKKDYLEPYNNALNVLDQSLTHIKQLTKDNPEQQKRLGLLDKAIQEKLADINQTIAFASNQQLDELTAHMNSSRGKAIMDEIRMMIAEISDVENKLLNARVQEARNSAFISMVLQVVAAVFSVIILIAAIYTIGKERKARAKLFTELDKYNKELLMNTQVEETSSTVDEKTTINSLIQNLKSSISFIKKIGSGNYDIELEGLTERNKSRNTENLAGELVSMRDQMKKVAEAEKERNWATEGLAKFADILRNNTDDLRDLSSNIISNLVNYLHANQGGLYILNTENDADSYLELAACYAFNRKKHKEQRIEIGEGLVGQAYLEREHIYMTDVPQDYINITSGLGGANPSSLLIVPLQVNEQQCGVVEIASFKTFRQHEIEFVKKIAESIASTIATVRINQQTKKLLEDSQAMTEQLRAQEEEMRQNLEEMQATQEQLYRISKEEVNQQ